MTKVRQKELLKLIGTCTNEKESFIKNLIDAIEEQKKDFSSHNDKINIFIRQIDILTRKISDFETELTNELY